MNNLPISTGLAGALTLGNKILQKTIMDECNNYKKQNQKHQKTFQFFDNSYRKSVQVILIVEIEYESLCDVFAKYFDETKIESFLLK